jgi:hypothetical protein
MAEVSASQRQAGSPDDGCIAGTAAQVAGQLLIDPPAFHRVSGACFRLVIHGKKAHHEPRCAESALRTVLVHHGLLHRVKASVRAFQVFDGDQLQPVQRGQQLDACVDRAVSNSAVMEFAQHDGAGAAIPLGAAFLAAGATRFGAQPLQHGELGIETADLDDLSTENETHRSPGIHQLPL